MQLILPQKALSSIEVMRQRLNFTERAFSLTILVQTDRRLRPRPVLREVHFSIGRSQLFN